MDLMDVSILIVNYNTCDLLKNCLASILLHTSGVSYDIVVIDNASTDGSIKMIENHFPSVRLVKNNTNIGFGRANNIGIQSTESKYVFLLNSDTVLLNNAIKFFFDFMEADEHSNVASCGGALFLSHEARGVSSGHFPSVSEMFFETFFLDKIIPDFYHKRFAVESIRCSEVPYKVGYVSGADMFIRRSALMECGGFDEDFFMYFEETELSYRFALHGYSAAIVPDARIIHFCGKSNDSSGTRPKRFASSRILYFKKCHGSTVAMTVRVLMAVGRVRDALRLLRRWSRG